MFCPVAQHCLAAVNLSSSLLLLCRLPSPLNQHLFNMSYSYSVFPPSSLPVLLYACQKMTEQKSDAECLVTVWQTHTHLVLWLSVCSHFTDCFLCPFCSLISNWLSVTFSGRSYAVSKVNKTALEVVLSRKRAVSHFLTPASRHYKMFFFIPFFAFLLFPSPSCHRLSLSLSSFHLNSVFLSVTIRSCDWFPSLSSLLSASPHLSLCTTLHAPTTLSTVSSLLLFQFHSAHLSLLLLLLSQSCCHSAPKFWS